MDIVSIATQSFSLLTILCQIGVIIILIALIIQNELSRKIIFFFGKHALLFSFLIALVATIGSLFYSEVAQYVPCKLCWYQRIMMYPQVVLLGFAYIRKDKSVAAYSILLSSIGAIIATYHYLLQIGKVQEILPCSAVGYSVSCSTKFVMTYGYITIPMMALSGFLLILFLMLAQRRLAKSIHKDKKQV
jgi:disulfide bond formation protein DsbB